MFYFVIFNPMLCMLGAHYSSPCQAQCWPHSMTFFYINFLYAIMLLHALSIYLIIECSLAIHPMLEFDTCVDPNPCSPDWTLGSIIGKNVWPPKPSAFCGSPSQSREMTDSNYCRWHNERHHLLGVLSQYFHPRHLDRHYSLGAHAHSTTFGWLA